MQRLTQQLKDVRARSRWLLVARRIAQCVAVAVPVAVAMGVLDYLLRLPGPIRLGLGLILLGVACLWLGARLARAYRFWPSLSELALRAERLYPQLAGSFASAVAFSADAGQYQQPATTHRLANDTVTQARTQIGDVNLHKLVRFKPTVIAALLAATALIGLSAITLAAPGASATAAKRWVLPLGQTQWPKRQGITSRTSASVHPVDRPLLLSAQVTKGMRDDMRMTIDYRIIEEGERAPAWTTLRVGPVRSAESQEPAGLFEMRIDLPADVVRSLSNGSRQRETLEYRFSAGDVTTETATIALVARPSVRSVAATIDPPPYAAGLMGSQAVALHEQSDRVATAAGYIGSPVRLAVRFNKPIPTQEAERAADRMAQQLGLEDSRAEVVALGSQAEGFDLIGTLCATAAAGIELTDAHGLRSTQDERRYRLLAMEDAPPSVVLLEPAFDESVLASASVPLETSAEDDIAVNALRLSVVAPNRAASEDDADAHPTQALVAPGLMTTGRSQAMHLVYPLELSELDLLPGDEVLITAYGQDVFTSADGPRDETASETRRLRVITEAELASQLRRMLRGVRSAASTLERSQRQAQGDNTDQARAQQSSIGRQIAAQQEQVAALEARLERNGAQDLDAMRDLLNRAGSLLEQARQASDQAEASLSEAENADRQAQAAVEQGDPGAEQKARAVHQQAQAGEAQDQARQHLAEVVAALDTGESLGEIESELSALEQDTQRVAQDTQELLPRTVGQDPDDLSPEDKSALEQLARRQQELAERTQTLLDKMRATADEVGAQSETAEQRAAAQTLTQALEVAQRQGLEQQTQAAQENLEENEIAQAAVAQQQAQATLDQMLEEMGKQRDRRQEELRRLMQELAQKLGKIITEQRALNELALQTQDAELVNLAQRQADLRRRTMLIQAQAMASAQTDPAAQALDQAIKEQANAIRALRAADRLEVDPAQAQALGHLEEALKLLQDEQQEQEEEQQREERAKLRQAYLDLAERQEALNATTAAHQRDEAYGRRDWRQINELAQADLAGQSFDQAQAGIRAEAALLQTQVGEAMVFQSMHRRLDTAAERAGSGLRGRKIDDVVVAEQATVALMLRAMSGALDLNAEEEKFERENQPQQPPGEGQPGEQPPPPLVPDLAEVKLLREMQVQLQRMTLSLDEAASDMEAGELADRLQELADHQRELGELGEQLIEKLRQQQDGPGTPEPAE